MSSSSTYKGRSSSSSSKPQTKKVTTVTTVAKKSGGRSRGGPIKAEKLWIGMSAPQILRQPALRTFLTVLSQNESGLGQVAGFNNVSYSYELGNMNGSADYTALFDSYRILKVEATIRPFYTTGFATFNPPTIYSVIDYDDSNTLTTASAFREYANVTLSQYETVQRTFAPGANIAAYITGGAATGYTTQISPWVDVGSVTVEHHGLKIGMDGGAAAVAQGVMVNTRFLVEFRCTR